MKGCEEEWNLYPTVGKVRKKYIVAFYSNYFSPAYCSANSSSSSSSREEEQEGEWDSEKSGL